MLIPNPEIVRKPRNAGAASSSLLPTTSEATACHLINAFETPVYSTRLLVDAFAPSANWWDQGYIGSPVMLHYTSASLVAMPCSDDQALCDKHFVRHLLPKMNPLPSSIVEDSSRGRSSSFIHGDCGVLGPVLCVRGTRVSI